MRNVSAELKQVIEEKMQSSTRKLILSLQTDKKKILVCRTFICLAMDFLMDLEQMHLRSAKQWQNQ